jgi:hypothetical protein
MSWYWAPIFMVLGILMFLAVGTFVIWCQDKIKERKLTKQYKLEVVYAAWKSGKLVTLDNKPFDFGDQDG